MDAAAKLQKIAAGRKKLKIYQQEKNKGTKKTNDGNRESLSSPSSEIAAAAIEVESAHDPEDVLVQNQYTTPQIQNYFNQSEYSQHEVASQFFDCVPILESQNGTPNENNIPYNSYPTPNQSNINTQNGDSLTIEDPDINPNEIFDIKNNIITNENMKSLTDYLSRSSSNDNDCNDFSSISTSENLKQLSAQINELVDDQYDNNFSDLEKRNLELASLYESEKLKVEQINIDLLDYKRRTLEMENNILLIKNECENRIKQDLGPLQEQLQFHMQTVGILVGEKTELMAALSLSEVLNKQKTTEVDELNVRLKTSRSRVADLEKELVNVREELGKYNTKGYELTEQQNKLKAEFDMMKEKNVEAEQDVAELRAKLKIVEDENTQQQQKIKELNSQISLANVKIQQFTGGDLMRDVTALENTMQEKLALEKQVADLNLLVNNAVSDRDQASNQYQQYVQQLNTNINNLAEKLNFTIGENENLAKRERELIKHIGELEKRIQTLQNEHVSFGSAIKDSGEEGKALDEMRKELDEFKTHSVNLEEKLKDLGVERDDLIREVESKKEFIVNLEGNFERMQSNQMDNTRLLAAIESDKVAAARAVQQNTQLKQQLEEMQEAFIKMTNDKAELADQLTTQQFKYKELEENLSQSNHQLHTLSEAIAIKDHELTEIRENAANLNKQMIQQQQLADRLRHYEANEHSSHTLVHDFQNALTQIESLKLENKKLMEHDHSHHDHETHDHSKHEDHDHSHHEGHDHSHHEGHDHSHVDEKALQNEIYNLKEKIDQLSLEKAQLQAEKTITENPTILDDHVHDSNKEMAMRQLESKFMQTMQDIANLQDEKQLLEHLVVQLQGETDTIGEYIALYQHQRGVLKQRAVEKESQIKQLAKDREQMKLHLAQLNNLVQRLMSEKHVAVTTELLAKHEALNNETNKLCEEHAKIHKEMQDETTENKEETAEQILALLSEIKSSNLVQPADVSESFHPCPWCSGQLITV